MIHPNIFKPRNDWAVISMNCKKYFTVNLDAIIGEILEKTNLTRDEFSSRSRKREYVEARQLYFYRARKLTTYSLEKIGSKVKNGDHATVLYGIRQVATIPDLKQKYEEIFNGANMVEKKVIQKPVTKSDITTKEKVYLPVYGVPTYN